MLGIVAGVLLQDQEVRGAEFQQLAYHRILIMLFLELNAPEQVLDAINFQVGPLLSAARVECVTTLFLRRRC